MWIYFLPRVLDFNPRPREEGDKIYDLKAKIWNISIHALVKRATHPDSNGGCYRRYFNPRPREEGDGSGMQGELYLTRFQSTPS